MFSHHLSSHEANELSAWLRLSLTDGVGNETARQWLAAYGLPQAIFEADPDALSASPSERLRRAIETVPDRRLAALPHYGPYPAIGATCAALTRRGSGQ